MKRFFQKQNKRKEIDSLKAQLEQFQTERDSLQEQLQQSREELDNYKQQFRQLQTERDRLQEELQQSQQESQQSQQQLQQLQTERDRLQEELQQSQQESQQSQQQLQQLQTERDRFQLQVHETQEELEMFFLKLQRTEGELGKLKLEMEVSDKEDKVREYQFLVWDAWYAYHCGLREQMINYLQLSLQHSPLSKTETILDWLNCFAKFAKKQDKTFKSEELTSLPEWKQLMQIVAINQPKFV